MSTILEEIESKIEELKTSTTKSNVGVVRETGDGVARISHKDGELHVMKLSNESWTKALWVNISYVGDVAVLNSFHDKRRFFDEKTENWIELPWHWTCSA